MKIRLSPEIIQKIPGIRVAAIVVRNVRNERKNSMIIQLLRGVYALRKKELQKDNLQQKIQALLEPTLQTGATLAETYLLQSLIKKTLKTSEVKSVNNVVDIGHYLALKHLVPMLGQDLDETEKDIELRFFQPKKGKKAPDLSFTSETKNLLLWLVHIGSMDVENFEKLPYEMATIFQKYCGGDEADIHFLNAHQPEADLYYVSEKEENYRNALPVEPEALPELKNVEPTSEIPLREKIKIALAEAANKLEGSAETPIVREEVELLAPREKNHGDYANNLALKLGKKLQKNPREVAENLLKNLPALSAIEKIEIAGAGFLNFHLSQGYLQEELESILKRKGDYGRLDVGKNRRLMLEYSSPNIAKPMGVHHLITTILGQVLANMLRFAHYDVLTGNYLGDWGTQFGKMIYAFNTWGDRAQIEKDPLNELLKLYVRFHDEAEKNPALEDLGRAEFKKLEDGDQKNQELWQWIRDISVQDLERLYQKLGVHFDEYFPESMYVQAMKEVLEEGKSKGVFIEGERGALIVQFEDGKYPPYLIQKADGATLYSTRDLASIKDRITRFHPEKILYVVDVAQTLHFQQLFATAQKLGYSLDGAKAVELVHVVFGRMQFPDGSMSTRKGTIIRLDELIREAETRAARIVEEKSSALPLEEKKKIIEGVALGAIKYQIVSQNRETNMTFDFDRMLALDGNSAPYLQYALARAHSILRKVDHKPEAVHKDQIDIFEAVALHESTQKGEEKPAAPLKPFEHPAEQALLRALVKFPEHLEIALADYKPNLLTNYLYELTQTFSSFYQEVPVLSAPEADLRATRLDLVKGFMQVLKNGLDLLEIATFERM